MDETPEQKIEDERHMYDAGMYDIYVRFQREMKIYTENTLARIRASRVIEEFEWIGKPCPLEEGKTAERVPINIVTVGRLYGDVSVSDARVTINIQFQTRAMALHAARGIVGMKRD